MFVLETARLRIRHFTLEDAAFVLALVNEPAWIRFIGDRGIRTLEDARGYIEKGPMAMVARHGFSLYPIERKTERKAESWDGGGELLGMCGLIKRDTLEDVDIGFAFFPRYWKMGYAQEAAAAVLEHARRDLGLKRIVAITDPANEASIRCLERLGFRFERTYTTPEREALNLYARETP